jgi:hypothetical protein
MALYNALVNYYILKWIRGPRRRLKRIAPYFLLTSLENVPTGL